MLVLKKVLKEGEEEGIYKEEELTPEQKKYLMMQINKLIRDPAFVTLQTKYGIVLTGGGIFQQFSLSIPQKNLLILALTHQNIRPILVPFQSCKFFQMLYKQL